MYEYKVLFFDRTTGTYTVEFLDGLVPILNYAAPRKDGAYLAGQELEDAIQLLRKPFADLSEQEYQVVFPEDDPSVLTGGEDIEAKLGQ